MQIKPLYLVALFFVVLAGGFVLWFGLPQQQARDVITVGTNSGYPPYEMLDEQGDLIGFDIDLARAIGTQLKKKIVFVDMAFDALILSLQQKKVDMVLAGLDITPKNKKEVDFVPYSPPVEKATLSILFWQKAPEGLTTFEDIPKLFDAAVVCVQSGTSYIPVLENLPGVTPKILNSMSDLIMDVKYGKAHACIFETAVAHAIVKEHPDFVVIDLPVPEGFVYEGTGIAIAKDNQTLYQSIDTAMAALHDKGVVSALRQKWFVDGGNKSAQRFGLFWSILIQLTHGAGITILAALLAILLGVVGGSLFSIIGARRISAPYLLKLLITTYTFIIRGTPMYVQILIFYFVLPEILHVPLSPFVAGVLAVGCNSIAYVSEILRGTINSLPDGQWEAAYVLGYSRWQTLRYIIFPQVFSMALPALANEGITITKDTSLLAAIGVLEVTKLAQNMNANLFKPIPIFLGVALIYLVITSTISLFVSYLEKRATR